jgi:hypothetical protein
MGWVGRPRLITNRTREAGEVTGALPKGYMIYEEDVRVGAEHQRPVPAMLAPCGLVSGALSSGILPEIFPLCPFRKLVRFTPDLQLVHGQGRLGTAWREASQTADHIPIEHRHGGCRGALASHLQTLCKHSSPPPTLNPSDSDSLAVSNTLTSSVTS